MPRPKSQLSLLLL